MDAVVDHVGYRGIVLAAEVRGCSALPPARGAYYYNMEYLYAVYISDLG